MHQYNRALKALDYLCNGAPACQKSDLPGCFVNNASNTLLHGQAVTENIATWIKEGYASGPFSDPPCKNFRVNPLLVAVQPDKIRTILNVSSPYGESYNSNVDENETEKVKMASAKLFSECLLDCGKNANMSKYDLTAAYKQVPCKIQNLRLQGFMWLGKYFVETRQVFGAKTSVCNYDIVGETLKLLALLRSDISPNLVLRQVDDVPCVSSDTSDWCQNFSYVYESLCTELCVGLAPICPVNDKAFVNQKRGKVLGVMFDSTDLSWRLGDSKISKALKCIRLALGAESVTLRDFQRLLGRINDVAQMCSFLKIFKQPLNACLAGIATDTPGDTLISVSNQAKCDLLVWAGYLCSEYKWLPIGRCLYAPPLRCREFVSDAAGLPEQISLVNKPGCGNVGFDVNGVIIFAHQLIWPRNFILAATDESGIRFGDKTTTLETIGLLLPMILCPHLLKNQHIVMKVDCLGTVFGMNNRAAKGDVTASVFIRAAYLIAAYLECVLHVEHLPRISDWGAEVTDRMSRRSTTSRQDDRLLRSFGQLRLPSCLIDWFDNPITDWSLPMQLLSHVKSLV
jgi:hypothetical protein